MRWPRFRLLTILMAVAMIAPVLVLVRAIRQNHARVGETTCRGNGFYLGVELIQYRNNHGAFPSIITIGPDGRTRRSWRTVLFAEVDRDFATRYDLTRSWDSEQNLAAARRTPNSLSCPNDQDEPARFTNFVAIVRPGSNLIGSKPPRAGSEPEPLLIEVPDSTIPWTKPEDIAVSDLPSLGEGHDPGGLIVVFSDGSVQRLKRAGVLNLFNR